MEAAWKAETVPTTEGDVVELEPGGLVISYTDLQKRWGWSRNQVRYFLDQLQRDGSLEKVGNVGRDGTHWRVTQSDLATDSHSGAAANSHSKGQWAQRLSGGSPHSNDGADSHSNHTVSHTESHPPDSHSESVGGEGLPADLPHGVTTQSTTQPVTHKKVGGIEEGKEGNTKTTPTPTRPRSLVAVVDELIRTEQRWGL